MAATERRNGGEFRVAGRTLSGTVLRYGDISPGHRERFLPGAFGAAPRANLNLQHDPKTTILEAGEFILADSEQALEIRAELPPERAALALVRRGALNGFSIEFHARRESRMAGLRVIERAELTGVALVDQPSYPASKAEVRRAEHRVSIGTLSGSIPVKRQLDCACAPGVCRVAYFEANSFNKVPERERDILAIAGEYSRALSSRNRGGVRLTVSRDGDLEYEIDVPDSPRGRALIDQMDDVDVYARPVVDPDLSDFVIADGVVTYETAEVKALNIGATDASIGWVAAKLVTPDDDDPPAPQRAARRRTSWLP